MKTSEIVYMINDLAKNLSDDATFTEDHILWLVNHFRAVILRKEYEQFQKLLSQSNTLMICLDVCPVELSSITDCSTILLLSLNEIPSMIGYSHPRVYLPSTDFTLLVYVSYQKFKYVNCNKFTKSIIYCSVGPDNKLYMKSSNPQFQYLEKVLLEGVFEDFTEASNLSCDLDTEDSCDIMDREFPMQSDLIPMLIEYVLKTLLPSIFRPKDTSNNANDDLASLMNFIRQNMKSDLTKLIEGND